jgi:hypothetical protein
MTLTLIDGGNSQRLCAVPLTDLNLQYANTKLDACPTVRLPHKSSTNLEEITGITNVCRF